MVGHRGFRAEWQDGACVVRVALKGVGTEMGRDQLGGSILHTEPQKKPVLEGSGQNRDKALSSGTLGSPC